MGLMFATRNPTVQETNKIRALLGTFRDGSGNQREPDGSTRANWREIERCIADAVSSVPSEDKNIFDVIALDDANPAMAYGFSIKSKQLPASTFANLHSTGRVYMEVANSPAKFWADIHAAHRYTERDFSNMQHAQAIGTCVLASVKKWHREGKHWFEGANPGKTLNLDASCYLCVSYSNAAPDEREYQIHAFSLDFPHGIRWAYKSDRCLTGYDPAHPSEPLFDWYGSSGGQLKYYPRGTTARYQSTAFTLPARPTQLTLVDKARAYFPNLFR